MAKPPFPWIGSKEKIAPYILQLFPPKLTQYVEPFGGSGAVLLALPPDPNRLDIYNDLDAELVNLFSCIKECSNVLLRELKFLPIHGRKLFEYYRDFVAHKEVYFQNVQAEIECLGDRSCFTEEQAGELLPIFQERLALYDVKRAAAYYLHAVRPEAGRWEYAGGILGVRSSVAWVIWDAQHFGVPQRRRRVFLVADFAGYSAIPILAIPDSVPGYVRIDYTNKQKQQKFTVFEIVVSPYNLVVISQFDEVGNQINFSTY